MECAGNHEVQGRIRRSSRTTTATVNDSYLLKRDTMKGKQRALVVDKLCSHHEVFFPCLYRADHD